MKFIFIIFLALFGAIITVSHFFVYYSINFFFDITKPSHKKAFLFIIIFLTFSFILSSILMHVHFNILTKYLYVLSSVWLGYLIYIILSLLIVWFIYWLSLLEKFQINTALITGLFLIGSLFFSGWGIYNAFGIKIKNIDLTIKNLPEQWHNKKIVQLSDIHLGPIYGENFIKKIISITNQQNPDLVLITGDYFDGLDGDAETFTRPINNLVSKKGVYFIMGNHEIYYGADKVIAAFKNTQVKFLEDQIDDIDGLQIVGTSYRGPEVATKIDSILAQIKPDKPTIVLSHAPLNIEKIKNSGASLLLCGHTHLGQLWPFKYVTKIMYAGFDYGLKQLGNLQVYTTTGVGTWGPPMRTNGDSEIVVFNLK